MGDPHYFSPCLFQESVFIPNNLLVAMYDGYTSTGKEMEEIPSLWFILIPFP